MNNSVDNDPHPPDEDISTVYEAEVSITVGGVDVDTLLDLCLKAQKRLYKEMNHKQAEDDCRGPLHSAYLLSLA
jgi:hypothetical protein